MSLTYVKLQDLRFLKTQLFDRVIARLSLKESLTYIRIIIIHQRVKLRVLHFDLNK